MGGGHIIKYLIRIKVEQHLHPTNHANFKHANCLLKGVQHCDYRKKEPTVYSTDRVTKIIILNYLKVSGIFEILIFKLIIQWP